MSRSTPEFSDLSKIEEELLVAKLHAARKAISHAGEKGRALESEVLNLIRSFLPIEYGLSTGFVAYHGPDGPMLSPQLDIIIYDSTRCGPLVRLESCDVFPLEAVYAYVEVKASLRSSPDTAKSPAENSIESCLETNKQLRKMVERRYWVPMAGSSIKTGLLRHEWMGIRSYLIAFEATGKVAKNLDDLAQRMADVSAQLGLPTHLHGVFIANHGFLFTRPVDVDKANAEDYYHVQYTKNHPLLAFKTSLLTALTTFPRAQQDWSAAIDQYYIWEPQWKTKFPNTPPILGAE
jgi:hypothetical protein